MVRKDEAPYRVKTENHRKSDTTCCLTKNDSRGRLAGTPKTKTSAKQAEKETERKCLRQKGKKKKKRKEKEKKAKKEAEHKSMWQDYNERQINTNARVK